MPARRTGSLLTLATLSVVATLGFARLFNDASWVLPVFLAAVKGDLAGIAMPGSPTAPNADKLEARAAELGMTDYA